jgi:hypothetical protein
MPSPSSSGASRAQKRLRIAAIVMVGVGLMVSVFLGVYVGAFKYTTYVDVDTAWVGTNMTLQPGKLVENQERAFNWMIFLMAFGPCVLSGAVLFSGAEVCGAVARRTRTRTSSAGTSDGETIALGD